MTLSVGGVPWPDAQIMFGAGVSKTPLDSMRWRKAGAIVSGTYTLEARAGNPGFPMYYPESVAAFLQQGWAVNWLGLPNPGIEVAANTFRVFNQSGYPLIVSVGGDSPSDIVRAVARLVTVPAIAGFEINFSCPNRNGGGVQSNSITFMTTVLKGLSRMPGLQKPLWIKVSHFNSKSEVAQAADLFREHNKVRALVASNSLSYATSELVTLPPGITPPHGQGGISGPIIHARALEQVTWFRDRLPSRIDVIGSGGVVDGAGVLRFLDRGACAVQLTSLPYYLGAPEPCFERLLLDEEFATKVESW